MLTPTPLSGLTQLVKKDILAICDFIQNRRWYHETPALESDSLDPLLKIPHPFGGFMMGFDFHLTQQGPKLIEVNTNAGGYASLVATCPNAAQQTRMKQDFVNALVSEYKRACPTGTLKHIVIVDDDITEQWLYPEMQQFAHWLTDAGYKVCLATPQEVTIRQNQVYCQGESVDFVYNRLTDFRLTQDAHAHLRDALIQNLVAASPHPSFYVRTADKRLLAHQNHPLIPKAYFLSEKSLSEWEPLRKRFVFKPLNGAASKGVYRGDRISLKKLAELPPDDTLVQELTPPPYAADGTKYDIRVFTCDNEILGIASRHFSGQVMEMRSEGSGIRWVEMNEE